MCSRHMMLIAGGTVDLKNREGCVLYCSSSGDVNVNEYITDMHSSIWPRRPVCSHGWSCGDITLRMTSIVSTASTSLRAWRTSPRCGTCIQVYATSISLKQFAELASGMWFLMWSCVGGGILSTSCRDLRRATAKRRKESGLCKTLWQLARARCPLATGTTQSMTITLT